MLGEPQKNLAESGLANTTVPGGGPLTRSTGGVSRLSAAAAPSRPTANANNSRAREKVIRLSGLAAVRYAYGIFAGSITAWLIFSRFQV